jgi:hypothetical protein
VIGAGGGAPRRTEYDDAASIAGRAGPAASERERGGEDDGPASAMTALAERGSGSSNGERAYSAFVGVVSPSPSACTVESLPLRRWLKLADARGVGSGLCIVGAPAPRTSSMGRPYAPPVGDTGDAAELRRVGKK